MSDVKTPSQGAAPTWERPALRRIGHAADVLRFPGEGKTSTSTEDMGDLPYKPRGLEMK